MVGGRDRWERATSTDEAQLEAKVMNPIAKLLAAGVPEYRVEEVVRGACARYDINRRNKGERRSVLGLAVELYNMLSLTEDGLIDPTAFSHHRPFTIAAAAERLMMSRGTVGRSVADLIEHGFLEQQRNGRSFEMKLLIPDIAIRELAADWVKGYEQGGVIYARDRELGERLLAAYS